MYGQVILGEAPRSFEGKPVGYGGYHNPAEVARVAEVEGARVPLYRMTDGRHPWPSQADVVRLLGGFSCRVIEGGGGHARLTTSNGLIDVVSPEAVTMAVHLAVAAERITAERGEAILRAIGEAE